MLNGRGVNIAQHAGNERFRALVHARYDPEYCTSYTTSEKRALASEIISHIKALNPPGRFLKRPKNHAKVQGAGLGGPWEELTQEDTIKKTCQALRDCNRKDRAGYGVSVATVPDDVVASTNVRSQSGMTNRELAQLAAKEAVRKAELAAKEAVRKSGSSPEWTDPNGSNFASMPVATPNTSSHPDVARSSVGLRVPVTLSGSKRKVPPVVDPLRASTPPVYLPAAKLNQGVTPSSPGGFSTSDFGNTDQLLSTYATSSQDEHRRTFSVDDDLVAALDDSKPRASDTYLDDFDGHGALPGVIQDSPPASPFSEQHTRFPET